MTILTDIATRIYNTIKSVQGLNDKVFPLVATTGTSYPFVTFERSRYSTEHTKDGYVDGEISYNINVVSGNYFGGLEIADAVLSAVLRMPEKPDLTSATESYSDDCHVQTLTFSF